jgi:RHS repeat-associated protein
MVSIRASFSAVRSTVTRIVALAKRESNRKSFGKFLNDHFRTGFQNTRRRTNHQVLLESLEPRHLMAAVPIANNDTAFYTNVSTDLVVSTSSSPAHLLANDLDIDGGSLTTSVVANPTSGTLIAFGTNGTFTYRPNTGFVGIDSFTYKVNDGSLDSNVATVNIAVGTTLLAAQNLLSNTGINSQLTTGNLSLTDQLTPDQSLVYRSDSLSKPIITVETQLAPGVYPPSAITAQLTFNGTAGTTYSYSTSGMSSGQSLRFALQADGSALATGMYDFTMTVTTTTYSGTTSQTFTGKQAIVNRSASEFGSGWWLDGLDRIVDSSAGALLVQGNGDTLWFAKSGSSYLYAAGDVSYSILVKTGTNTFILTSKTGIVSNFSTTGLLTSIVDTNSNTTSVAYADRNGDSIANELISITDPFGRVTNFNYTSGKVSSIAHFSGRTTTLTISSGNLTSYTLTDPDGAGALSAPVFAFGYTSGKLTSSTNAVSNVTSYSFNSNDGRLRTVTHPDSTTWQLVPIETIGLPTGTSGNTLAAPTAAQASVTDERGGVWKFRTDRFGLVTESITALGFISTIRRNMDGLPVVANEPDPDGTGPMTGSVSMFGYNSLGDTTHTIAPDGGVTTATYSSTLHRLLSTTDPVGRTQSLTYDSAGNMLMQVDGAGYTATFAYNSRGLPTSITPPDPDGSGSLASPVTSVTYDSYGRMITLTNPDASTKTFTYNSADQLLTTVDELGKTVTNVYDSLGRQTSVTNRVAATTTIAFDAMSRAIMQTDALGNVTDVAYNNRGWISKVTYPDADGAGPLARGEDTRAYDGVGNLTSQGEPSAMYSSSIPFTYDSDNRQISKGDPATPGVFENWGYDNAGRLTSIYRASIVGGQPDRTVLVYDASGRVIEQRVESQPLMGAPTVRSKMSFGYSLAGESISQTDARGFTQSKTYNSRGLVATETLPDPDGTGSQFGLVISHAYDNMGRETSVDRGFGRVTTLEYNSRSWTTKVTKPDPDGTGSLTSPIILVGYNVRGDQTTFTDELGNGTTRTYDDEQRPTGITYPDPDGSGALTSPVTSVTYNALNWITSSTDARGSVTSYTFDALGRVLTKTDPDPDGAGALSAPVTTNLYSASGLSKVTDPLGHDVNYGRDGRGRVISITDGLYNVTSYEYDYYNNITKQTDPDPDGSGPLARPYTMYSYDSVDRLVSKVDPLSGTSTYAYDLASNLTSLKDPVNNTTYFAYDGFNRLVLNTNSLGKSKSYTFDEAGNMTRAADRNGRVTQFEFDTLDRQTAEKWQQSTTVPTLNVATTQEGGAVSEQQSVGWSTSGFDMSGTFTITQNGQTTSSIAWNASVATIQSALESLSTIGSGNVLVTLTSPNTYSRTIGLTFRNGKAGVDMAQSTINTSGLYSMMGSPSSFNTTSVTGGNFTEVQTITLANATNGTWRLAYNGEITAPLSPSITSSQLKTALDAMVGIDSVTVTGSSGSFTVTFSGTQSSMNMSQIFGDAANATNGTSTRTITTVYDAADRLTSLSDPSATIAFTRDNLGRATTIGNTINGLTPTITLNQAFDSASNRTELKATVGSSNDFKNNYQYDALQRITDIVQQSQSGGNAVTAKHVTIAYNALNQRTSLARYQSTGAGSAVATTSYTFDSINRLSTLTHTQGSTTLAGYTYAYDGLSRPTSVNSTIEGLSTFTYDATSQLTGADHTSQTDETYGFDANGNRNTSGYTTGSNNQITAGLGFTYTYDDEGNRLTRTETSSGHVQSYEWDHRNRLVAVKDRNTSGGAIVKQVNYEYDAFNRLVHREYDADGAGSAAATNQYWVYDEGINAVLQFEGSGASSLSHRYLWSNQVDELLADEQVTSLSTGGNTLWGLGDHLGTLRDIADLNEGTGVTSVTNHRTYNAFGKLTAETNITVDLLFGYTGKQLDEATGLQHNLFRWYDSAAGEWMSEDPLGYAAGDVNLNRYVGNLALSRVDPSGLQDPLKEFDVVIAYQFETIQLNANIKKEIQRILDDMLARFGKAEFKIKVTYVEMKTQADYEDAESHAGINKENYKSMLLVVKENSKLPRGVLGQGAGFKGTITTDEGFRTELERQRIPLKQRDTAIAAAIIHEVLYHGVNSWHIIARGNLWSAQKGFVDSAETKVGVGTVLSDEACKAILTQIKLLKDKM